MYSPGLSYLQVNAKHGLASSVSSITLSSVNGNESPLNLTLQLQMSRRNSKKKAVSLLN